MEQLARIHMQQDKNNGFFGVGDVVRIKSKNGEIFEGEITCIEIKKEGDKLHPIMDIKRIDSKVHPNLDPYYEAFFWIENIAKLEIIRFKGEKIY